MAEKGGKRENAGRKQIGTVVNIRKSTVQAFSKSYKAVYSLLEGNTLDGIKKLNEVIEKCFFVDDENEQVRLPKERIAESLEGYPQEVIDKVAKELSKYVWRMDEKTLGSKVVTPRVLGYVFEQVINQKEKGAYYTSEDTTDYISENTILLAIIEKSCYVNEIKQSMVKKVRKNPNAYSKKDSDQVVDIQTIDHIITNNYNLCRVFLDAINEMDEPIRMVIAEQIKGVKIIDPTVGTGAFMVAAIKVLLELHEGMNMPHKIMTRHQYIKHILYHNLYGVDMMPDAIEILKLRVKLLLRHYGLNEHEIDEDSFHFKVGNTIFGNCNENINNYQSMFIANTTPMDFSKWKEIRKPFDWNDEFPEVMNQGGFDCVIGNPPYVEEKKSPFMSYNDYPFMTAGAGNLYTYVIERSFQITSQKGIVGLIVPISLVATPRMAKVRKCMMKETKTCFISSFADRPASLFSGVHQKLNIFIAVKGVCDAPVVYTSEYLHWSHKERNMLFHNLQYIENEFVEGDSIYLKVGNEIQNNIMKKVMSHSTKLSEYLVKKEGNYGIHLNMRMTFWCKCFLEEKASKEYKSFYFDDENTAYILNALLNSSLFFMLWETVSDCWHITNKDFEFVRFDLDSIHDKTKKELIRLSKELEMDLERNKEYIGSKQTDYIYQHKKSKRIIDEIDYLLAKCYGFTKEELSYILNYNLEYRMSDELSNYLEGEK